jgi:hypothetical protein
MYVYILRYSNTILYACHSYDAFYLPCYIPLSNRHKITSVCLHALKALILQFARMHTGFWWEEEGLDVGGRIILQRVDRYWVTVANIHISTATNQHAQIAGLLETAFATVVRAEEL